MEDGWFDGSIMAPNPSNSCQRANICWYNVQSWSTVIVNAYVSVCVCEPTLSFIRYWSRRTHHNPKNFTSRMSDGRVICVAATTHSTDTIKLPHEFSPWRPLSVMSFNDYAFNKTENRNYLSHMVSTWYGCEMKDTNKTKGIFCIPNLPFFFLLLLLSTND